MTNEQSSRHILEETGIADLFEGRDIRFLMSRAEERRIHSHIDRMNASGDFDDDPITHDDQGIEETIGALLDRGLTESERDAGFSALLDGRLIAKRRYPWRLRVKLAWKELRG